MKKPSLEALGGYSEISALMRSQFVSAKETADGLETPLGAIETWSSSFRNAFTILLNSSCPMFLVWDYDSIQTHSTTRTLFYNDAYLALLKETQPLTPRDQVNDDWTDGWHAIQVDVEQVFTTGQALQRQRASFLAEQDGNDRGHLYAWSYSAIWDETNRVRGVFATGYQVAVEKAVATKESIATATVEARFQDGQALPSHPRLQTTRDQSLLQQAEAALRESETRFQAFMNHSPTSAWIADQEGRLLYLNPTYAQTFQLPQDAVGKPIHDIYGEEFAQQFLENNRRVFQTGQVIETVETAPRSDGSLGSFLVYKFPITQASGAMLLGGIAVDITERQQTEETLRQQEAVMRLMTNALPVLVAYVDKDYYYRFNNQTYETWFGQPTHSFIDQSVRAVVGDAAYEALHPYMEQAISGQWVSFESQISYREGGIRHIKADYMPHTNAQGEIEGFFSLVSDISDRKQAEAALRESEARFQAIVRNVPGTIYRYTSHPDGSDAFTYVSEGARELLELEPETIIQDSSSLWALFHPDDLPTLRESVAAVVENLLPWQWEGRLISPSGQLKWIQGRSRPQHTVQGTVWDGLLIDITERKQAEQALRRSEEWARLAIHVGRLGGWRLHLETNLVEMDERMREIWGEPSDAVMIPLPSVIERMHPDDRLRVTKAVNAAIDPHGSGTYEIDYRIVWNDGTERWVLAKGQAQFEGKGEARRAVDFFGTLLDITDRKQAEEARYESEAKFRTLAAHAPVGIFMADVDGNCLYVNDRWCTMAGMSLDAAQGQGWLAALHPDDRERTIAAWYEAAHKQQSFEAEYRFQTPQGNITWLQGSATALRRDTGEIAGYIGTLTDVTDRKQAEAALAAQEHRYRYIFEAVSVAIWEEDFSDVKTAIDQLKAAGVQDFRQYFVEHPEFVQQAAGMVGLRDVNQAALRMFGTADKAQLLTSLHRIFVPETQEAFIGELLAIAAGEPFFAAETVLQNLQGDRFDVWFTLTLPPRSEPYDRVLVSLLDISGRKRAEVALRDSIEQLSLALTAAKLGDWSWQAATDIVTLSEQAAAIFGIPPGPYITWTQMQKLLHPDDRERARLQVEQAIAEHSDYDIEYRVMRPDSTERWIAAKGRAQYDSSRQALGMLGVVQDITQRKQTDTEREQLLAREQVAREEAERANRIKDEFLAVLSHELRSPLNPILGWSKLLQQGKLDAARTANALATIERNAKLQVQLIDDLLDISRILRGKLTLNTLPVSLSFVITAAIDTVRLAIDAKAIQLKLALNPAVGSVLGDAARLQQVVWNLLANAAKFTLPGGQITVALTQTKTYAQLQVKDTGKGIHPDFLPFVFEHFRQEDGATTRKFGGLGLGLAIVRQIVEMHGGNVQAESPGEGLGATFTVRLPLANTRSKQAQTIRLDPPAVDLKGLQVLVVDDEADMRELAAFVLEQQGAVVITAASAQEALTLLDRCTPNVLLSDIGMPDMDGYMLMRNVRSRAVTNGGQIPAIALTAYAGEVDQQQALAAGFQQHLAKPIEPIVLIDAIASLLSESPRKELKP